MVDNFSYYIDDIHLVESLREIFIANRYSCKPSKRGSWGDIYEIPNGMSEPNAHCLYVKLGEHTPDRCLISGSIRKWHLGALSDTDLSPKEFADALSRLSEILMIDISVLYNFTLSKIEVGLNYPAKMNITTLAKMVKGYRSNHYVPHRIESNVYYQLNGKNSIARIYDKKREIEKSFKKIRTKEEIDFSNKYKDMELLRFEFAEVGNKRIQKFVNVSTIGDIANNYTHLLSYFFKGLRSLTIENGDCVEFMPEMGSMREYTRFILSRYFTQISDIEFLEDISKLIPNSRKEAREKRRELTSLARENNVVADDLLKSVRRKSVGLYCPKMNESYSKRVKEGENTPNKENV